jgi:hypothetical protein
MSLVSFSFSIAGDRSEIVKKSVKKSVLKINQPSLMAVEEVA